MSSFELVGLLEPALFACGLTFVGLGSFGEGTSLLATSFDSLNSLEGGSLEGV